MGKTGSGITPKLNILCLAVGLVAGALIWGGGVTHRAEGSQGLSDAASSEDSPAPPGSVFTLQDIAKVDLASPGPFLDLQVSDKRLTLEFFNKWSGPESLKASCLKVIADVRKDSLKYAVKVTGLGDGGKDIIVSRCEKTTRL